MKRLVAIAAAAALLFSTAAFADSLGSAVGGQAGNQSNMAGGLCLTSPVALSNGQQRSLLVDCTTGALLTSPASGGPSTNVVPVPSSAAAAGNAPVSSTAAESCHVLKASAGNLYSLSLTITTVTGYLMVFNATSAPADGAVTPAWWQIIRSDGTIGGGAFAWPTPIYLSTGITVCFSSTGPFNKTASATAAFSGGVQ